MAACPSFGGRDALEQQLVSAEEQRSALLREQKEKDRRMKGTQTELHAHLQKIASLEKALAEARDALELSP